MDELILLELERLRQMLVIASKDVAKAYKCRAEDYLHDLSTRDYFEEQGYEIKDYLRKYV